MGDRCRDHEIWKLNQFGTSKIMWDSKDSSPESDELNVLVTLAEAYEREHYPIDSPVPSKRKISV
jgi:antitoxin component HigA of HigAB toxin-antitoxin module